MTGKQIIMSVVVLIAFVRIGGCSTLECLAIRLVINVIVIVLVLSLIANL